MNPPALTALREPVVRLLDIRTLGSATALTAGQLAYDLAQRLHGEVDIVPTFAEPFVRRMVSETLGFPIGDWDRVERIARVAFNRVPSVRAVTGVEKAWSESYGYWGRLHHTALASAITGAMDRASIYQKAHTLAGLASGFAYVFPVLSMVMADVARRRRLPEAVRSGVTTWDSVASRVLESVMPMPAALPRVAARTVTLPGTNRRIEEGTDVLPSLAAVSRSHSVTPWHPALSVGTHYCPGGGIVLTWLASALSGFYDAHPEAALTKGVELDDLRMPKQVMMWLT